MDYSTEHLRVRVQSHIASVTFDRPPVNATAIDSFREIKQVFDGVSEDRDVRVVILTGAGRAFSVGGDMKAKQSNIWGDPPPPELGATVITDSGRVPRDAIWSVMDCSVPVIAAVNGPAIGAGLAIASVCDYIIASERATFGMTEINVGVLGGSSFLIRMLGPYVARHMFYTGDVLSADDLRDARCFYKIVGHDQLMNEAQSLAERLAEKSPIALRLAKESVLRVEQHYYLKDGYRIEQDYTRRLVKFEDSLEARQAFVEKRPPEWKWR